MSDSIISIQPKYRQAKDWIIEQIKTGKISDGSFLPSETELSRLLKVGKITVRAAIDELSEKNIILKQQGRRSIINASAILNKKERVRFAWLSKRGLLETEEIYFQIYNYLLRETEKNNTDLLYINLLSKQDMKWFIEQMDSFDGIILSGVFDRAILSPDIIQKFEKVKNLVMIDDIKNTIGKFCISTDNYAGGKMAAEFLMKQHFTNPVIGIRKEKENFLPMQERIDGFCDCLNEKNVHCKKFKFLWYPETYAETRTNLYDFLNKNPKIDAFFCITDVMAISLLFCLKSFGIKVPEDISVLGYDGIPRSEETFPVLTTIQQPTKEIAIQLFENMKKIENGEKIPSSMIKIKPSFKIRESVKIANEPAK